jgi:hypothetical protein
MSASSFQDMLDDAKASGSMDVDTSFLDEFRRTGVVPSIQTDELEAGKQDFDADEPKFNNAANQTRTADGPPTEQMPDGSKVDLESFGGTGAARAGSVKGRGGGTVSSGPAASGGAAAPGPGQASAAPPRSDGIDEGLAIGPKDAAGAVQELDAALDAEDAEKLDRRAETEMSAHRKTDQQDAIQAATGTKGGGAGGTATALPESGFRIEGLKSQPMVRNLPRKLMEAMRAQLRVAAVRELGASAGAAEAFTGRLSQGALVMAFLLAQLDVRISMDPATQVAAELFRSQDPLLGSVVSRMDSLEQLERDRAAQLEKLHRLVTGMQATSAVIEQAIAYSIADRTVNFLRGTHDIHDAPITHEDAIYVRDKAREETQKRRKLERDRDGRPIR